MLTVSFGMSSKSNVLPVEALDQEFENIIQSINSLKLQQSEIYEVFAPLRWYLLRRVKLIILVVIAGLAVRYISFLNWNASALGRLAMIQLLPYWDWRPLYKERCLIQNFPIFQKEEAVDRSYTLSIEDCAVCEVIDFVPKLKAVSFDYLNGHHLLRNLPAVISDSHHNWKDSSWENLTSFLKSIEPLLMARPCNVQTNLMFGIRSSKNNDNMIADLFDILLNMHSNDSWFLHFRNCELKTVKQTRLLIDKPYFYPAHLEMPYTTWILMSNNYPKTSSKRLNLDGLIIIMQLKGITRFTLRAKERCDQICSELAIDMSEGESLVFSTKLWMTDYIPTNSLEPSISFVTETYQS